jgi:hypothetical protein
LKYHAQSADCGYLVLTPQFRKDPGCTLNEYGDPYDRMGGDGHFNAPHKEFLGWFEPSNIETVERLFIGENRLYHLEPLETATNGLKVLKIARGGGDFLYVEFRKPVDYDRAFMGLDYMTPIGDPNGHKSDVYNGATLHVFGSKDPHPYIIDLTPDGSTQWPKETHPFSLSVLPVGSSFTDPVSDVRVTVDSITRSGSTPTTLLNISIHRITPREICLNGIDDDGDGEVDESACLPPISGKGEICDNGIDDNGNGYVDEFGCTDRPLEPLPE